MMPRPRLRDALLQLHHIRQACNELLSYPFHLALHLTSLVLARQCRYLPLFI